MLQEVAVRKVVVASPTRGTPRTSLSPPTKYVHIIVCYHLLSEGGFVRVIHSIHNYTPFALGTIYIIYFFVRNHIFQIFRYNFILYFVAS